MVERPLFAPDRRGVAEEAGPAAAAGSLRLAGVARDGNGRAVALFSAGPDAGVRRLRLDERLERWRLVAVNRAGIELTDGDRRLSLAIGQFLPP